MNGENLEDSIKSNLNVIDYIQVAGVLGRAEPDIGDIDFKKSLKFGYDWISRMGGVCIYAPNAYVRRNEMGFRLWNWKPIPNCIKQN